MKRLAYVLSIGIVSTTLSCASSVLVPPTTVRDILRGKPRVVFHTPNPLRRGQYQDVEFMVLGHPSRDEFQQPFSIRVTIVDRAKPYSHFSWGDARVKRYYRYRIDARFTRDIKGKYVTIQLELRPFRGTNILGQPIVGEPFIRQTKVVRVMDPVAGGTLNEASDRPQPMVH